MEAAALLALKLEVALAGMGAPQVEPAQRQPLEDLHTVMQRIH